MRRAFIEALSGLAAVDDRVWLLVGDLGFSVVEAFADRFPQRFLNAGVAEQNMVGVAAGLALTGKLPFVYSIANFPVMRCLEQIRNDVCYHDLPVTIVAVGGGVAYGSAGYTHHAVEDLAVMRAMPNMRVLAPGDPVEVRWLTRSIPAHPGPCYLRLGKGGEPTVHAAETSFTWGGPVRVREGTDVTIISTGAVLPEVVHAAETLARHGVHTGVISLPVLKPLDTGAIARLAIESGWIVTVEEHGREGGLGETVAAALADCRGSAPRLIRINLPQPDELPVGSQACLCRVAGLNADSLVTVVLNAFPG
jgi:transketolase